MCYSAQIRADHRTYVRLFGANVGIREFVELFYHRQQPGSKLKIPKGMELAFAHPQTPDEVEIKGLIDAYNGEQATKFEQELFAQRTHCSMRSASWRRRKPRPHSKASASRPRRSQRRGATWQTCEGPNRKTATRESSRWWPCRVAVGVAIARWVCSLSFRRSPQMRKAIFIGFIVLGAALGLFSAMTDSIGVQIVTASVGVFAGVAIGGALSGIGKRRQLGRPRKDQEGTALESIQEEQVKNYWLDRGRLTAAPGLPNPDDTDPHRRQR